ADGEHSGDEDHERVALAEPREPLVASAQAEPENDDAKRGAGRAEREREDAERRLHASVFFTSTFGGLYSLPCLIMMRSESNAAPVDQCPSQTTGAPALNRLGGSPWWITATVALPSVISKSTPLAVSFTVPGTTFPAMRKRCSPSDFFDATASDTVRKYTTFSDSTTVSTTMATIATPHSDSAAMVRRRVFLTSRTGWTAPPDASATRSSRSTRRARRR